MTKGRGLPDQIDEFKRRCSRVSGEVSRTSRGNIDNIESNRCGRCGEAGHKDARSPRCPYSRHYTGPANYVQTGLSQPSRQGGNRNSSFRILPSQNRRSVIAVQPPRNNRQYTSSRSHAPSLSCIPPAPPPSLASDDDDEAPIGCFSSRKNTQKNSNFPRRKAYVNNSICRDCRMLGHKDMNDIKCAKFNASVCSKLRRSTGN